MTVNFDSYIGQLDYLNMSYIFIPAEIVRQMGGIKNRVHCTVNGKLIFQGGFMNLSEGNAYISINKARMKAVGVTVGDAITISLEKDTSEFGMPMPEELAEVLLQDEEGKRRFDQLKIGMQRYFLFYVSSVKSPHLRVERAVMLIRNLKMQPEGKENFGGLVRKG